MNSKLDITQVVDNYLCHSCGSCFSACGHDCIEFNTTAAGYLFPKIDYDKCTNCELCFDVCPGDHFTNRLKNETPADPFIGNTIGSYVGKATDDFIYKNSQSGGAATAILKYLFESGEIKAAIVTSMNMHCESYSEAKIVTSVDDLIEAQKSKYIPTNINSLMQKVQKLDGAVALVGLSCHMHGLENLLTIKKKLRNKIIKIGLICDRVLLSSSVDFLSSKTTNEPIEKFVFRDTTNTGYPGDISVVTNNNQVKILNKKSRMIMKDYFTPTRCMLCFDKMNIYSDIVVGDPHGIDGVDRINGESLVISRTNLGDEIVEKVQQHADARLRQVDTKIAQNGQRISKKRTQWNAYINAWRELGFKNPDYPDDIYKFSIEANRKEIDDSKKAILHAIKLDKFDTRQELLEDADQHYAAKINKQKPPLPIRIYKSILKRIIK